MVNHLQKRKKKYRKRNLLVSIKNEYNISSFEGNKLYEYYLESQF